MSLDCGIIESSNGVSVDDPNITKRIPTIEKLWEALVKYHVVFIRSPPYSGKTSLLQLFADYHLNRSENIFLLDFLSFNKTDNFDQFWIEKTKKTFKQWLNVVNSPTIILLDEVQILYDTQKESGEFWALLKSAFTNVNPNLYIVLVAAYGDRPEFISPTASFITFPKTFGVELLKLQDTEFDDIINRVNKSSLESNSNGFTISEAVRDSMWISTAGHVGLVTDYYRTLFSNFKAKTQDQDVFSFVLTHKFLDRISSCKAMNGLHLLDGEQMEFLDNFSNVSSFSLRQIESNPSRQALIKMGLIATYEDDTVAFAAPLFEVVYFDFRNRNRNCNKPKGISFKF
eukprot:gene5911-7360_t